MLKILSLFTRWIFRTRRLTLGDRATLDAFIRMLNGLQGRTAGDGQTRDAYPNDQGWADYSFGIETITTVYDQSGNGNHAHVVRTNGIRAGKTKKRRKRK